MLRQLRGQILAVMFAAVVSAVPEASAQWGYPGGYGGFGWGGWGATTALGDEARGMGMFAAGAGQYNLNTAQAQSINADTAMRFNEYVYQSQQVANRRHFERLAQQRQATINSLDTIQRRLRDNPEARDITNGDALNVALDEITRPGTYAQSVSAASAPLPSDLVRNIPFKYAPQAITISLDELTSTPPPDLIREPQFAEEVKAVKAVGAQVRKQADEQEQVDPALLAQGRTAIKALQDEIVRVTPPGPARREAENYLKALYGLTKMLEIPDVDKFLKELDTVPETTLGALIGFMHTFNLRFAAAQGPRQRSIYNQLFPKLVALRTEVSPQAPPSPMETASAPKRSAQDAQAFFSGMQLDEIRPSDSPAPAPPAAAPAPPAPGQ